MVREVALQNRVVWILSLLAVGGTLAAVGVGLNGYRQTPRALASASSVSVPSNNPRDDDPLAPRLFDQGSTIQVHVAGAVRKPGVYTLPSWARVNDAVKKAGGASPRADLDAINLADHLKDAEQVRIPVRGRVETPVAHLPTPEPPPVTVASGGHQIGRYPFTPANVAAPDTAGSGKNRRSPAGPVNLNTATQEQLESLPGIGPSTAAKIMAYRQQNGPFQQADDLMNVSGIGPGRFAKLRSLVIAP